MPDQAPTRSARPDDSLSSPAWADGSPGFSSPGIHDAVTANTPATGGDSDLADYGSGIGRSIGKFKLLKRLGAGGNGQVYAAQHTELGKTVALKFFKAYAAAPPQLEAMRREAQTLAALRHPGIVSVDDFSVHEPPRAETGSNPGSPPVQIPYIVMEYVPNEMTLGQWARSTPQSIPELLRIGAEMCDAVEHAHERGIIHRDLKPGNVLVDIGPDGRPHPRVIDFGLSQLLAGWGSGPARGEFARVTGTLMYMSPEQLGGNPLLVDHRSDVYALGVVLYELLCGRLPYTASVRLTGELTNEIRNGNPVPPSQIRPELKGPIEDMLLRALDKDPSKRHQRAGDLAQDLQRILNDEPLAWRSEPVVERAGRAARVMTKQSRVLISLVAAVLAIIGACGLWTYGGAWAPMSTAYARLATWVGSHVGSPAMTSIDNVRIIEMRDGLDVDALAAKLGVDGMVSGDKRSTRRLHGRLMERLALAEPHAVTFDLYFPQPSPHDEAFNRGVQALRAKNIGAVIGVEKVRLNASDANGVEVADTPGVPELADSLRGSGADWGYIQFNGPVDQPLTVALVTRQQDRDYIPSLAMSTVFAANRHRAGIRANPGFDILEDVSEHAALTTPRPALRVYWRPEKGAEADSAALKPWTIKVSAVSPWTDYASWGFAAGDEAAHWSTPYPPRDAFAPACRDYADVLTASDEDLRAWAHDKIILVGDARPGVDRGNFGPYTDTPYVYAHAAAIDSLCKDISLRYPWEQVVLISCVGGLLGASLGFVLAGRPRTQLVLAAAFAVLITGVCLFLYAAAGIMANPFVIIATLVIAMALTAGLGVLAGRGALVTHTGKPA